MPNSAVLMFAPAIKFVSNLAKKLRVPFFAE